MLLKKNIQISKLGQVFSNIDNKIGNIPNRIESVLNAIGSRVTQSFKDTGTKIKNNKII
ncbi:MAG: hypothetical protein RCG15_03945 [Candidatus Rickettsia vulgarisii]